MNVVKPFHWKPSFKLFEWAAHACRTSGIRPPSQSDVGNGSKTTCSRPIFVSTLCSFPNKRGAWNRGEQSRTERKQRKPSLFFYSGSVELFVWCVDTCGALGSCHHLSQAIKTPVTHIRSDPTPGSLPAVPEMSENWLANVETAVLPVWRPLVLRHHATGDKEPASLHTGCPQHSGASNGRWQFGSVLHLTDVNAPQSCESRFP